MPEAGRTTRVPLVARVLEANDEVAADNRAELERQILAARGEAGRELLARLDALDDGAAAAA